MTKKKYDVFISYSRKNLEVVKAIKKEIEETANLKCWMDLEGIESGAQQFTQDIVDGINGSRIFLFMLSKESQNSKFALRELNFAMKKAEANKQKRVVIVNIDNCQMCDEFDLMYGLSDTIAWQNKPQRDKLIRDIREWMATDDLQKATNQKAEDEAFIETLKETNQKTAETVRRKAEEENILRVDEDAKLMPVKGRKKRFGIEYGKELYGYADETGKNVIPYRWKWAGDFHEGLAPIQDEQGKYGFIDVTGKEVIHCLWKDAWPFSEGLAHVRDTNNKEGFIDKTGNIVIPCQWNVCWDYFEGLAMVKDSSLKWWMIDKTGKKIPCQWKEVDNPREDLAAVKNENDLWGYIDKQRRIVIPCQWKHASFFSEGVAKVQDVNGLYGYIDKTGRVVIPCQWKSVSFFHEGLAAVQNDDDKYGYIDDLKKVVIPYKWKYAFEFYYGRAMVMDSSGKYGFIDKTGKEVIPCRWNLAWDFKEGDWTMVADENAKWRKIDRNGNVIK